LNAAKLKMQKKDKTGALLELKRKKTYELQSVKAGQMIISLENQIVSH